jgi:hypothetical protein
MIAQKFTSTTEQVGSKCRTYTCAHMAACAHVHTRSCAHVRTISHRASTHTRAFVHRQAFLARAHRCATAGREDTIDNNSCSNEAHVCSSCSHAARISAKTTDQPPLRTTPHSIIKHRAVQDCMSNRIHPARQTPNPPRKTRQKQCPKKTTPGEARTTRTTPPASEEGAVIMECGAPRSDSMQWQMHASHQHTHFACPHFGPCVSRNPRRQGLRGRPAVVHHVGVRPQDDRW